MAIRNKNGVAVEMTAQEVSEMETMRSEIAVHEQQQQEKFEQEQANKASAKAKLMAGEALTEAEADTIVL